MFLVYSALPLSPAAMPSSILMRRSADKATVQMDPETLEMIAAGGGAPLNLVCEVGTTRHGKSHLLSCLAHAINPAAAPAPGDPAVQGEVAGLFKTHSSRTPVTSGIDVALVEVRTPPCSCTRDNPPPSPPPSPFPPPLTTKHLA